MICQKNTAWRSALARARRRGQHGGFTLIEAVAVLALLGILGIMLAGRIASSNAAAITEADVFKAALRYAQARAMADIYTWGISIDSATSYSLVEDNPNISGAILPGSRSSVYILPSGVTFTAGVNTTIRFDWRGEPVVAAIADPSTAPSRETTARTILMTQSSDVSVKVWPDTGFVE